MSRGALVASVLGIIGTAVCVAILLEMRDTGWPGPHHDAVFYITPAVNRANGAGNTFAVYHRAILQNEPGGWTFRAHGQLYQATLAQLMATPELPDLMRAMGLINIIAALLGGAYFWAKCRLESGMGPMTTASVLVLGVAGTAAVQLFLQGRPEHIIPLILFATGLARLTVQGAVAKTVVAGVEVALIVAASPLPGIVAASARLVQSALEEKGVGRLAARCVLLGTVAVVVWYCTMLAIYPYDPLELAANTAGAGRPGGGTRRALSHLHYYWLFDAHFPLIGLPFAVLAFVVLLSWLRGPFSFVQRVAIGLLLLNLGFWVSKSGIILPGLFYNLVGFYPVVLMAGI
jgi:hypothetical protein